MKKSKSPNIVSPKSITLLATQSKSNLENIPKSKILVFTILNLPQSLLLLVLMVNLVSSLVGPSITEKLVTMGKILVSLRTQSFPFVLYSYTEMFTNRNLTKKQGPYHLPLKYLNSMYLNFLFHRFQFNSSRKNCPVCCKTTSSPIQPKLLQGFPLVLKLIVATKSQNTPIL